MYKKSILRQQQPQQQHMQLATIPQELYEDESM
jgi:hypothetical protein